jgi:hypothetical protein
VPKHVKTEGEDSGVAEKFFTFLYFPRQEKTFYFSEL